MLYVVNLMLINNQYFEKAIDIKAFASDFLVEIFISRFKILKNLVKIFLILGIF